MSMYSVSVNAVNYGDPIACASLKLSNDSENCENSVDRTRGTFDRTIESMTPASPNEDIEVSLYKTENLQSDSCRIVWLECLLDLSGKLQDALKSRVLLEKKRPLIEIGKSRRPAVEAEIVELARVAHKNSSMTP